MDQAPKEEKEIVISFDVKNIEKFALPVMILVSLGILLWVTFGSNIIFGDEGFHAEMSKWIASNMEIPKFTPLYGADLYKLAYTKYVAAHVTFAGLFYAFGFSEILIKFFVPLLSVMTAILMYKFLKDNFSIKIAYLSVLLFVSIPIFLTYSVLYYADVFLMFFLMCAIYFFFEGLKKNNWKYIVLTGVFTGLSILTKKSGFALIALFGLWGLYTILPKRNLKILKPLAVIAAVTALLVLPWFVRNFAFFNTVECGFPFFSSDLCTQGPVAPSQGDLARTPSSTGSDATLSQFGLKEFVYFVYSETGIGGANVSMIFLFSLIGVFLLLIRRNEADVFALFLFLIFTVFLAQQTIAVGSYRVEDFAREFMPSVIPIVVGAMVFLGMAYEFLTKYHKILGAVFVLVIISLSLLIAIPKAGVMKSIKQFIPEFYEGAKWMRDNTPLNANVLSLWTHQTVYTTERNSYWPQQSYLQIFGSNNQTSIDTMKSYGFNYIFVQTWSIADGLYYQNYPSSFINFLNGNNETFTKTFQNNGVIIYKVN